MKKIFLFVFLLFVAPLVSAEVSEKLDPPKVAIGEKTVFRAEWKSDFGIDWKEIRNGFLYLPDQDIPYAEITQVNKRDNSIEVTFVFFASGTFPIPLEYSLEDDEPKSVSSKIEVVSPLKSDSETAEDILGPLRFSGPYLLRLVLILLGIILLVSALVFFLYWRTKFKNKVHDAIIEPVLHWDAYSSSAELRGLLEKGILDRREFATLLFAFIRDASIQYLGRKVLYLTEKQLLILLKDRYGWAENETEDWIQFFVESKYAETSETIDSNLAKDWLAHWQKALEVSGGV